MTFTHYWHDNLQRSDDSSLPVSTGQEQEVINPWSRKPSILEIVFPWRQDEWQFISCKKSWSKVNEVDLHVREKAEASSSSGTGRQLNSSRSSGGRCRADERASFSESWLSEHINQCDLTYWWHHYLWCPSRLKVPQPPQYPTLVSK